MDTFESEFKSYRANVMPPKASKVQVQECKRAFFMGAKSAMRLLAQASDAPTEDEGVKNLEAMHEELRQFKDKVVKGKA